MVLKHLFLGIVLFNVILQLVHADDDGGDDECSCVDLEMEELKICKDWEDAPVQFNVKLQLTDEHATLNGSMVADVEISEGVQIGLLVFSNTPNGKELVYSAGADLCQSLKEETAVWWPIVEAFGTKECPIPKGEYKLSDVKINFSSMKGFMVRDLVGLYTIGISIEKAVDKFMCFELGAEIYEETRLRSKCPNPQDD